MRQNAHGARAAAALVAVIGTLVAAGCGSSGSSGTTSGSTANAGAVSTSQCGTKPGVKATGTPIPLGGIVTNQPGTSFTDIANMANAHLTCAQNHGRRNGPPIEYLTHAEQINPPQLADHAEQLVQTDHV